MKNPQRLKTIDGEKLLELEVNPPEYVVSQIMPNGLHLLAGSPKVGKSWLVLWMCDCIAKGKKIWEFDTFKSTVLYLSLEDNVNRLYYRLACITEQSTKDVKFSTKAPSLGEGLLDMLEQFIEDYPDTGLIVIDTLQLIRDNAEKSSYQNDYKEVMQLKEFTEKYKIAVLLVHHLRKKPDSDPINMVSGSTGLIGAVDSIYVLEKAKRVENKARLHITGRDVEDKIIELEFDRNSSTWQFVKYIKGDEEIYIDLFFAMKNLLKTENPFKGTATELFDRLKFIDNDLDYKPNIITRIINQNILTLENTYRIKCQYKRTNKRREICLTATNESTIESA